MTSEKNIAASFLAFLLLALMTPTPSAAIAAPGRDFVYARAISPNSVDYDFSHIVDFDLAATGELYILHGTSRVILCLSSHGLLLGRLPLPNEIDGEVRSLSVLPDDRFLIGTTTGLFLLRYDGAFERKIELSTGWVTPSGRVVVVIESQVGLRVAGTSEIKILVPNSGSVMVFDIAGRFLQEIGQEDAADLKGVAIDAKGNIYTLDQRSYAVRVYEPGGRRLSRFGRAGGTGGGFSRVSGISVLGNDEVWVADVTKSVFHVYSTTGTFLRVVPVATPFGGVKERSGEIFAGSRSLPGIVVFKRATS